MPRQLATTNTQRKATYAVPLPAPPEKPKKPKATTTKGKTTTSTRELGTRKRGPNKKITNYLTPEQHRDIIMLADEGQLTQVEIAAQFGITQPAVSYLVKKARQRKREAITT